jgi:hypothetical protein
MVAESDDLGEPHIFLASSDEVAVPTRAGVVRGKE